MRLCMVLLCCIMCDVKSQVCQKYCYARVRGEFTVTFKCCSYNERRGSCPKGPLFIGDWDLSKIACNGDRNCPEGYKCCSDKENTIYRICKPVELFIANAPSTATTILPSNNTSNSPTTKTTWSSIFTTSTVKPIGTTDESGTMNTTVIPETSTVNLAVLQTASTIAPFLATPENSTIDPLITTITPPSIPIANQIKMTTIAPITNISSSDGSGSGFYIDDEDY